MAVTLIWVCALPAWLRMLMIGAVLLGGGLSLRRQALLAGPCALRALEWPAGHGDFVLFLGPGLRRIEAESEESRQFGTRLWRLRFRTSEGPVDALVDTGRQDPRTLRRLGRRLFGPSRGSAGPVPAAGRPQAATIPDKV